MVAAPVPMCSPAARITPWQPGVDDDVKDLLHGGMALACMLFGLIWFQGKLQTWCVSWRRWRVLYSRRRFATRDPFVRLKGGKREFENRYELGGRLTNSTYGSLFRCRAHTKEGDDSAVGNDKIVDMESGMNAGGMDLVVKIVPMSQHPLVQQAADKRSARKRWSLGRFATRAVRSAGSLKGRHRASTETSEFLSYMTKLLSLRHSNIIRYMQFYADSSSFYFVMEWCPGRTLVHHLLEETGWYEADARPLVWQLLRALNYVHWRGLIHRDVKLENLMVSPIGCLEDGDPLVAPLLKLGRSEMPAARLQLLDFGLGCQDGCGSGAVGTIGYVAPEAFDSRTYSYGVDVFSAAVVTYILFTGRPPFKPPICPTNLEEHVDSLRRGPSLEEDPLPLVTADGLDLLDWMLLPEPGLRCNTQQALEHGWFDTSSEGIPGRWLTGLEETDYFASSCIEGGDGGARRASSNNSDRGAEPLDKKPELWTSNTSELRFLQVMGVWSGSSSRIGQDATHTSNTLQPIAEIDESEEAAFEELCCRLVRKMPVPVCIADPSKPDCPIVAISSGYEKLTGHSDRDIVGKKCRFLNQHRAAEMRPEMRDQLQEASIGLRTFMGVVPDIRKDGTRFNNLLHVSPIQVQDKTYVIGIQQEVESSEVDVKGHEIVGVTRKVHTVIRHWLRGGPHAPGRAGGFSFSRQSSNWSRQVSANFSGEPSPASTPAPEGWKHGGAGVNELATLEGA